MIVEHEGEELDELACSSILLTLTKTFYFYVSKKTTAYGVWQKLCDMYEKQNVASQIYWLKKLLDINIKESMTMSNHCNKFNMTFSQRLVQVIGFFNFS